MIQFYFHATPNPLKVALLLEELGQPYEVVPVDTRKGEQHQPAFRAINPNGKLPAIVDTEAGATVFDSNAILLYLAHKTGQFLGPDTARGDLLSWLMFVATGIGPYSGQAVHFKYFAPEPKEYPLHRYTFEAERHWGILDAHLANRAFVTGDTYTIADMAVWGWSRFAPRVLGEDSWGKLANVRRLMADIEARPAVARVDAMKDRHAFKAEMDAEARRHMFPSMK